MANDTHRDPSNSSRNRFAFLAVATTAATYLLILVGALVRASGAGLGCPDWPKCYGQWIPPTHVSQIPPGFDPTTFNALLTWTEYLNRLLGITVGLLITATVVGAVVWHRHRPQILWPSVAALLLVGFEGWLGGQVVRSGLEPWMITAHLVVALVIVTLLLFATFRSFELRNVAAQASADPARRKLFLLTSLVIVLLLVQVGLGTQVRAGIETALKLDDTIPRDAWLDQVVGIDSTHRGFSNLFVLALVGLNLWIRRRFGDDRALVRAVTIAAVLTAAQIGVGILLAHSGLPATAQIVHLSLASLLLGALVVVALLGRRTPRIRN